MLGPWGRSSIRGSALLGRLGSSGRIGRLRHHIERRLSSEAEVSSRELKQIECQAPLCKDESRRIRL